MKATLEFILPEDNQEYERCTKGEDYFIALQEIAEQVFRPHRKHGYSDCRIQELLNKSEDDNAFELVGKLEELFYEILDENNIKIW